MDDSSRRTPLRMCVRCKVTTSTPVPVESAIPGCNLYACPDCAHHYLTPATAWRLVPEHAMVAPCCRGEGGLCPVGTALNNVHRAVRERART